MLTIRVTVPVAGFRRPFARAWRETEPLPPPSTCYGFLLSIIGETDVMRHVGVRVTSGHLRRPSGCTVFRSLFRHKEADYNHPQNKTVGYQDLLTGLDLLVWICSDDEEATPTLEERVRQAIRHPETVTRFGCLSLGESSHIINDLWIVDKWDPAWSPTAFLLDERGPFSLTTWPDYASNLTSRFATGNIRPCPETPVKDLIPSIGPRA